MAKVTLVGQIASPVIKGVVGNSSTAFKKFLVSVAPAATNVKFEAKPSYFGVTVFGKLSEISLQTGTVLEIDGELEISKFQLNPEKQATDACVINARHIITLQGNVKQYAKAYNVLGNLVQDNADVYTPESGKNVYSQKIAINKKVGDKDFPSFYRVKFFGDRGETLFSKGLLSKEKVKSILVDGTITSVYNSDKNDVNKKYHNCDINADDFQIAQFSQHTTIKDTMSEKHENPISETWEEEIPF